MWMIRRALGEQDPPDTDSSLWAFEVGRDSERRRVEVLITGQAKHSTMQPVLEAVNSDGQSVVIQALDAIGDAEPPNRITVTMTRIDY
jgi:hypothetical protein